MSMKAETGTNTGWYGAAAQLSCGMQRPWRREAQDSTGVDRTHYTPQVHVTRRQLDSARLLKRPHRNGRKRGEPQLYVCSLGMT